MRRTKNASINLKFSVYMKKESFPLFVSFIAPRIYVSKRNFS